MRTTSPRRRIHISLRGRLLMGYGTILLLLLISGTLIAFQFNRVLEANIILQQESLLATQAEELSRAALELVVAIDMGILLEDGAEFAARVSPALERLERQHQIISQALPDTLQIDTTVASLIGLVRPMMIQAEAETWSVVHSNRVTRMDEQITRMTRAIDEIVDRTQATQVAALAQAAAAQRTMYIYLFGSISLSVLLSIWMIGWTVRAISGSVDSLALSARRLAAGQLDERVKVDHQDELGQLAWTFNQMAEQLQSVYSSLEQRVAERTRDLEQRSLQLEAAAEVARDAAAIHNLNELFDATVRLISRRFGFYHAGIFVIDEARQYALLRAASSEGGQRMLERGHKLRIGQVGIVGYTAATGLPRIALDVGADAVYFDNPDLPETRSEMALPLKARGEMIGVLDVQSIEPRAFSQTDVAVLQTMSDQVALAIENARLIEQSEARLREVNALLGRYGIEGWAQIASERPGWGYVYDGVDVTPHAHALAAAQAGMTVPLRVRDTAIGHLSLLVDGGMNADQIELVEAVVEQASIALDNARLYQQTQRALREVEALNAISNIVSRSLELGEVLKEALQRVLNITDFEAGLINLVHPETNVLYLATHHLVPPSVLQRLQTMGLEGTLCQTVYLRREPLSIENLEDETQMDIYGLVNVGFRSYIGVPLESRGRVVGTLSVYGRTSRRAEPAILSMLTAAGQQMGVAVENAQLFEEARRRAEQLQISSQVVSRFRTTLDMDLMLQTAVRAVAEAIGAADVEVRLVDQDGTRTQDRRP